MDLWRGVQERRSSLLVGRSDVLSEIEGLVRGNLARRGVTVILHGDAGVGKSRLVRALLDHIARGNTRQLVGGAQEMTHDRPFATLADVLASDVDGLTQFADVHRMIAVDSTSQGVDDSSLRFRILDLAVEAMKTVCSDRPLVMAVEDIHWADSSSLSVLQALAGLTRDLPLALVCTRRPYPQTEELTRFISTAADDEAVLREVPLSIRPGPRN